ncbi:hypothetical protein NMG60_11023457 [Bertholletia excelsa]
MASLAICNLVAFPIPSLRLTPESPPPLLSFSSRPTTKSSSLRFCRRNTNGRGSSVVTRAGPSTSTYVFAFVLPLSLLAITVFTSLRIADKLDKDFLEELAINQAIMEADQQDADADADNNTSIEEKPAPRRIRNRPKREAETSSK